MGILATARRGVSALIGSFGFEGVQGSRRLKGFPAFQAHINSKLSASGSTLIARARYLALNNGYANNVVEGWSSNVIASGITPRLTFKSEALKKNVQTLWNQWTDEADADMLSDFYGLQRRAVAEMFTAGEVFIRMRIRRPVDDLSVPLQLQLIPSEQLPMGSSWRPITSVPAAGNEIRQGIEFNPLGQRVAYHFLKRNPGDVTSALIGGLDTVRVPASEIIHLIDPKDAGQIRGVSRFTSSIVKLFVLDAYDDAELDRKKVAAMYALFIKTAGDAADLLPGDENSTAAERQFDLQPGMVAVLDPGEDIATSQPAESGQTYEPFQYRALLQIAAGLGVPYSIVTGDMVRANYSNTRASLVEFRRRVEAFQYNVMIFQFCRTVFARWMDIADLSGALNLPGYETRRREYVTQAWLPPKFDWVDPLKDANAEIAQINAGLKSRSQAIAERGYDAQDVDNQIAEDKAREKRLGLDFSAKPDQGAAAAVDKSAENRTAGR